MSQLRTYFYFAVAQAIFIVTPSIAQDSATQPKFRPMSKAIIPLNSPQGRQLLREADASEAYWQLSQFYVTQPDLGSCGVASCLMVLNALPITRPNFDEDGTFKFYTPDNFFKQPGVTDIKSRLKISQSGMTLEQLSGILGKFDTNSEHTFASKTTIDSFRSTLLSSLNKENKFIIINYNRQLVGQEGKGHISPVVAYNRSSDKVLILDTASYRYPFVWIDLTAIWKAMSEGIDSDSNMSRGYVVVSAKHFKE